MKQKRLTFEDILELIRNQDLTERLKARLAYQEALDNLPYRSPEQIEKDWSNVKRYYGVS